MRPVYLPRRMSLSNLSSVPRPMPTFPRMRPRLVGIQKDPCHGSSTTRIHFTTFSDACGGMVQPQFYRFITPRTRKPRTICSFVCC